MNFFSKLMLVFTTVSFISRTDPLKVLQYLKYKHGDCEVKQEYDYIVIGAGTAGSIIANRLSEDPDVAVLLLEAGGEEPKEAKIPSVAPYLQLTDLDWQFKSASSDTSCLGMINNRCNLPSGKLLGGSSSINFMLYVRGNRNDYDAWRDAGNPGWGYEDVLPLFKKSEDNRDKEYAADIEYHNVGGYQKIQKALWKTDLADAFLEAGREIGYRTIDVNARSQTGFMQPQGFHYMGQRQSSATAFLNPIRNRKNLKICINSRVSKIHFDRNRKTTGITFRKEIFSPQIVNVKKEIIVSAGGIATPQLLMLSGIGPAPHLRKFNITPIVDLSVGRNMQDHVASALTYVINKSVSLRRKRYQSFASLYKYLVYNSGPLSTLGSVEALGFVNTRLANKALDWPDIEYQFASASFASDGGLYLRHIANLKDELWKDYFQPLRNAETFTIVTKMMRPRSRGFVELTSTDINQKPKVVTNYLTESLDVKVLTEGLKIARKVGRAKALKKFGAKLYAKPMPGCEHLKLYSNRYYECYLRHLTLTIYHYSGTAKMGPSSDPNAVVDPQLRVYGTTGLRVADASIFPTIPTGNTNAAVMMVAEKAAEMLQKFWRIGSRKDGVKRKNTKTVGNKFLRSSIFERLVGIIGYRFGNKIKPKIASRSNLQIANEGARDLNTSKNDRKARKYEKKKSEYEINQFLRKVIKTLSNEKSEFHCKKSRFRRVIQI